MIILTEKINKNELLEKYLQNKTNREEERELLNMNLKIINTLMVDLREHKIALVKVENKKGSDNQTCTN